MAAGLFYSAGLTERLAYNTPILSSLLIGFILSSKRQPIHARGPGQATPRGQPITPIPLPANFDNGDIFVSTDVRLTRTIKLYESLQMQLIGEVFNLFNVSNLDGYSGILNAANYGIPTRRAGGTFGTGVPRAFQLAARLTF
jgi:hypothetical protein